MDQFTSQPEYWQKAEELAKGKPSTLHIVLPEAYLGTPQEESRLAAIRAAMQDYRDNLLTRCVHGYVYVERTQMDGTIRQGLVGAVDLEQYLSLIHISVTRCLSPFPTVWGKFC